MAELQKGDDDRLLAIAMAIADGSPVDWDGAACSTPLASVSQFQHLERVVRGHDALRSTDGATGQSAAHETILTEAQRRGVSSLDGPAQVHWGPLVVLEKVGRGSFGDVYRAWDPKLDRQVALKLVPEDRTETASGPVVHEGQLLARVRHPNVLTVFGAGRVDGRVGIWTEYVRGETLAQEAARRGPLAVEEAARVGMAVSAALAAVHAAGLLHRDVKAQNVMRDDAGRIILGDFGTGVTLDERAGVADPQIAGTPLYLAPEVCRHGPASVASDLYSLGVLLYFLVTGSHPVKGRTLAEVRRAHAAGTSIPLREARPDLPAPFADVVDALLETDPARRLRTAAAVEQALRECLDVPAPATPVHAPTRHQWRLSPVIAFALVGILAVSLGVTTWLRSRPAEPPGVAASSVLPLDAGDWIVVAAYENRTGETLFDGTIEAAVTRELEYSDFVRVAQRARVGDALQSVDEPLEARLDRLLARKVSLRDGDVRVFVAGSIAAVGNGYEIVSEIVAPETGTTVTRLTERAQEQSEVLAAVRRQTLQIRHALGEPQAYTDRTRVALENVPVPRLKAFRLYAEARADKDATPTPSVEQLLARAGKLRDAVDDDPTFAVAAWLLAETNVGIELRRRANEGQIDFTDGLTQWSANIMRYSEQALGLVDTATPRERYRIIAAFHHMRTGSPEDPEKVAQAAAAYEALLALQPDDESITLLQNCYRVLGRERDAAALDLRLAEARPRNVDVNFRVARQLLTEGNGVGARRYALRAQAAMSPSAITDDPQHAAWLRTFSALAAWLDDDVRETLRSVDEIDRAAEQLSEAERREVRRRLWHIYLALGRARQAEQILETGAATGGSDAERWANQVDRASFFAVLGDAQRLRDVVSAWPDPLPDQIPRLGQLAFLIDARRLDAAGRELQLAKRLFEAGGRRGGRPAEAIFLNFEGAMELARGRYEAAIDRLDTSMQTMRTARPEMGWSLSAQGQWAAPKLAEALEWAQRLPEAIGVLEEAGARRSEVVVGAATIGGTNRIDWWMSHRAQLARLYRKNGQIREAEAVEAHLLKLLAVAEPDFPLLQELHAQR